MELLHVVVLAGVQGLAELLPVSSSAHVIVAEKLLGLDPTSPPMTLLLVMLHTGTMGAVLVHFGGTWRRQLLGGDAATRRATVARLAVATALTGAVGLVLLQAIKHLSAPDPAAFEVEHLFGNARLMAAALASAGVLIVWSAWRFGRGDPSADDAGPGRGRTPDFDAPTRPWTPSALRPAADGLTLRRAAVIGAVQGLCLPFRGFSRSGATISAGLLLRVPRARAEEFSFALAVVLTPVVIAKEAWRLVHHAGDPAALLAVLGPSLLGAALAFVVGLAALRWLSAWLDQGRWHWFGVYCLAAAGVVLWVG